MTIKPFIKYHLDGMRYTCADEGFFCEIETSPDDPELHVCIECGLDWSAGDEPPR